MYVFDAVYDILHQADAKTQSGEYVELVKVMPKHHRIEVITRTKIQGVGR